MTTALAVTLCVYAVFGPALFYVLWRLSWPAHRLPVPVPESLIDRYNVSITSDSDIAGLV